MNTPEQLPLALLVEDDNDTCAIYSTFLGHRGFRVVTADSARAAFEIAISQQPDIIITDVRLSGSADGIVLAMKLRLDPRTTGTPIIIVTGDALRAGRERALAAGCDIFLPKPCPPDVLAHHARTLIAA